MAETSCGDRTRAWAAGEQYRAHLGGPGAAEQSRQLVERALAIRRNLAAANPGDLNLQFDLLDTIVNVATIYYVAGDLDRALQLQQLGLQIEERLAANHHSEELQHYLTSHLFIFWAAGYLLAGCPR